MKGTDPNIELVPKFHMYTLESLKIVILNFKKCSSKENAT